MGAPNFEYEGVAIGGITSQNISRWIDYGAAGIGVASSNYKLGDTPAVVAIKAKSLVARLKT